MSYFFSFCGVFDLVFFFFFVEHLVVFVCFFSAEFYEV